MNAENIQQKKQKLIETLGAIESKDERLRYIIARGKQMPPLPPESQEERYLVPGCLSRAWLVPEFKSGQVHFAADSEAMIVKGIMAILLEVYNNNTPDENLGLAPDFLADVGITEHLSMNRRNGLANLCKQIRLYSAAYKAMAQTAPSQA